MYKTRRVANQHYALIHHFRLDLFPGPFSIFEGRDLDKVDYISHSPVNITAAVNVDEEQDEVQETCHSPNVVIVPKVSPCKKTFFL